MDQPVRSSRGKMTKIARSLAGKWTSLIVVLQGNVPAYLYFFYPKWLSRMYVLAFGPLPSASQNDDASTGLVPGLKLTKMRVRTFWTAPKTLGSICLLTKSNLYMSFNMPN